MIPYKYSHGYENDSVQIYIYNKYESIKAKQTEKPKSADTSHQQNSDDELESDFDSIIADDGYFKRFDIHDTIMLDDARGIIRFEVRSLYHNLYSAAHGSKWGFETQNIYNFISNEFTENMLLQYLGMICFPGNYYTLETACRKVKESDISCHKKTKESLLAEYSAPREPFVSNLRATLLLI